MGTPSRPLLDRRRFLGTAGAALAAGALAGCTANAATPGTPPAGASSGAPAPGAPGAPVPTAAPAIDLTANPAAILPRATVPVLCWHQLRDWRPDDSVYARKLLICPPAAFTAQIEALAAAGWTTIGPDDYLAHLTTGAPLPPKPVLLSFDDSQGSQIVTGLPALQAHRMTATFFVMTVPLDKPNWMTRDDVRRLHGEGMTVAAHTYDHHRADRYTGTDWQVQLDDPRTELERIVGVPVRHFAYPYGAWAPVDFDHLTTAGYVTGFQLGDHPVDATRPLYTLRRILVDSSWTGPDLLARLDRPV